MVEEVAGDRGELTEQARMMLDNLEHMLAPKSVTKAAAKKTEEA
jgi:hypothetical protein